MSASQSTSPAASQPALIDPLVDSMLDFSDYDNVAAFGSPALSPATASSSKAAFARPSPTAVATPASLLAAAAQQPVMAGPSHQYDQYKQQTGIVPGALATTFAVNQNNAQIAGGYSNFSLDFLGMPSPDDLFDFNAQESSPDMDMDFDSPATAGPADPADPAGFFFEPTVNPTALAGHDASPTLPSPPVLQSQSASAGRVWPGMHQQAALAKAQAQQKQQQQIIQQQRQKHSTMQQRAKAATPPTPSSSRRSPSCSTRCAPSPPPTPAPTPR